MNNDNGTVIFMAVLVFVFIFSNVLVNRKLDGAITKANDAAIEQIKGIVGHSHFDELLEAQRAYYNEYFGINEEEQNAEVTEVAEDSNVESQDKNEEVKEEKENE